jgi:hypothetical protein
MIYPRKKQSALKKHFVSAAVSSVSALAFVAAGGQTAKPAAATAASPAIQLQTYIASDQSASAGVPAGWKMTRGDQTVIQMTGPDNETVSLGNTVVARNAPFQLGEHSAGGIDLSMPYSATLPQKFTMILQQSAASSGKTAPQVTIDSTTPLQLPAAIGECGRIVAEVTGQNGDTKVMAVFCSLPVDSGGTYKNIMLLAQAFSTAAAQLAPTAQAIFQSYRIPTAWLQKKLAPFTAPPPKAATAAATAAAAGAINRSTALAAAGADNSVNCFDLSVLRETPTYDLPRSCGGTQPD